MAMQGSFSSTSSSSSSSQQSSLAIISKSDLNLKSEELSKMIRRAFNDRFIHSTRNSPSLSMVFSGSSKEEMDQVATSLCKHMGENCTEYMKAPTSEELFEAIERVVVFHQEQHQQKPHQAKSPHLFVFHDFGGLKGIENELCLLLNDGNNFSEIPSSSAGKKLIPVDHHRLGYVFVHQQRDPMKLRQASSMDERIEIVRKELLDESMHRLAQRFRDLIPFA